MELPHFDGMTEIRTETAMFSYDDTDVTRIQTTNMKQFILDVDAMFRTINGDHVKKEKGSFCNIYGI